MKRIRPGFIVLALLVFPALSAAADMVRWVDEHGVVHFTDPFSVPEKYRGDVTHVRAKPAGPAPDKASIPLQMRGQIAVVPALINNSAYASLIVDTGASSTVISHAVARQLGIETEGKDLPIATFQTANGIVSAPVVTLESIEVGGMQVRGLMATVHDISPEVSGLLGLNYLGQFRMDIDSHNRLLHLEKK